MANASADTVDVKHLAKLTAITVSDEEAAKLQNQFTETLKVVNKLNELDTSKITPTPQVTGQTNRFRQDNIDPSRILSQTAALSNAKHAHQGFFVVPAVFDQL